MRLWGGALACALALWSSAGMAQDHGSLPQPAPAPTADKVDSLDWRTSPPMVTIYEKWVRDESTRIGASTRPVAASQGPLPACFAAAASQGIDMTLCSDEPEPAPAKGGKLAKAGKGRGPSLPSCAALDSSRRVSSLWLSRVGNATEGTAQAAPSMPDGGSVLGALRYALAVGESPSEASCQWPDGDTEGPPVEAQRQAEAQLAQAKFAKERQDEWREMGKDSYMAKYWAAKWGMSVASAFPSLKNDIARGIDIQTHADALGAALWRPGCDKPTVKLPAGARAASVPVVDGDMEANLATLKALLASGRQPIVTLCLDQTMPAKWNECRLRHAMVVVAVAKYAGEGPKDSGWGLWALNSWGERWQKASADGWVRAEPLMRRAESEFVWVERADKAPYPQSTVWPSFAEERGRARLAEREGAKGNSAGAASAP